MSLEKISEILDPDTLIVMTTHKNPDGDGIGSEIGLKSLLEKKSCRIRIINSDPLPAKFAFMDPDKTIEFSETPLELQETYNLFVMDTSDPGHLGKAGQSLIKNAKSVFFIDHHNGPFPEGEHHWIMPEKSSTCEMICDLAEHWRMDFDLKVSRALYGGIVYDTGSFIYPKTTERTFQVAADLVSNGVKPKEIHSYIYENKPASSFRLLAQIQSTFYIEYNDQVAIQKMTYEMVKKSDSDFEAAENVINYPLKCPTILVSILFKENAHGEYRASIRSKGEIDVSAFSIKYGGGGHKNAAGFPIGTEEVEKKIKDVIKDLKTLLP